MAADFQAMVDSFQDLVEKQVTEHNMTRDRTINMEEVCLTVDNF